MRHDTRTTTVADAERFCRANEPDAGDRHERWNEACDSDFTSATGYDVDCGGCEQSSCLICAWQRIYREGIA